MAPTLLLKAWRDVRARRWQTAGLVLLIATMIIATAGASRAKHMLANTREVNERELVLAHLEIRCSPTLPGLLDRIRGLPGIEAAEEAMLLPGVLHWATADALPAVVRVLPEGQPQVNKLRLLEGHYPQAGEQGVVLDRSMRTVFGLQAGDTVELEIGDRRLSLPVLGIYLSPDSILFPAHSEFLLPLPGTVAAMGLSAASAPFFENTDLVDSLRFRFEPGRDPETLQQQLLDRLGVSPMAVIRRTESADFRTSAVMLRFFDIYLPPGLFVLTLVALTLLFLTLQRLIRSQAAQIGLLVALGYRAVHIAAGYLLLPLIAGVGGVLIGTVAHLFYARFIFDSYVEGVGFAALIDPGPGSEIVIASVTSIAVASAIAFGLALYTARGCASRLMRPSPARGRRIGPFARVCAALGRTLRVPLSVALGLRHLTRRPFISAVTIICLALNLGLVVAFLYVHVTHVEETKASLARIGLDGSMRFSEPVDNAAVARVASRVGGVAEPTISAHVLCEFPTQRVLFRALCLMPDGWIRSWPMVRGHKLADSAAHEVVIDQWVSDTYGLDVGDSLPIYPSYSAPESTAFQVVGILAGATQGLLVLPLEAGRQLLNLPGLALGLDVASDLPPEVLMERLRQVPHGHSVQSLALARKQVSRTFAGIERVLAAAVLMSVVVAVLFLALLAALDTAERGPELAVLRALGWRDRSMLVLCMTEVLARGWLALLLAIPIAPLIGHWLVGRLCLANSYHMDLVTPPWGLASVAAVYLLLIPLGALPALRVARRITRGHAIDGVAG